MRNLLILALLGVVLAACAEPSSALFRAVALGNVAAVQAEAGDLAGARETAALALESAERVSDDNYPAWAWSAAAAAQATLDTVWSHLDLSKIFAQHRFYGKGLSRCFR